MITVNDVLPTVELTGGDNVDENARYQLTVDNLFDPGDDTATLIAISWGDGTPLVSMVPQSLPRMFNHYYADGPANYLIVATVIDEDGNHEAATKSILVNNVAPTAALLNGGPVVEGSTGFVQLVNANDVSDIDEAAGFSYSYDFDNDGSFEIVASTSDFMQVPGTFLNDPEQTIRARIEDKDGGFTDLTTTISVSNVAPVVSAGDDATAFANELFSQEISFTDPGNDAPWTVRIDWDGDAVFDETIQTNDREFQITHAYGEPEIGMVYAVSVEVDDQDGGVHTDSFDVTIRENSFRVVGFVQHPSGVDIQFNRPLETDVLNLYDGDDGTIDLPDLSVVGDVVGPVSGSIVWDEATNTLSFVRTGGVLLDDTYTVTLLSTLDAFQDLAGNLLDGDADFAAGGDYLATFDVAHGMARVVGIGDFARGADQVVDLTPEDSFDIALPIMIDDAEGVTAVDLHIVYDPALLTIAAVTLAENLPPDWMITVNDTQPGRIQLTASGATALSGANVAIYGLDASVPSAAPYGDSQTIRLENLRLNEDQIPSVADVAVHHAVYLSDASGDGQLTALDASLISRIVVALDSGFDAHERIDPLIVADVTRDGTLSGYDASLVGQIAVGLPAGRIPADPDPLSSFTQATGPQRIVRIQSGQYGGSRGSSVEIPLEIDEAEGLLGVDLALRYDTAQLSFDSVLFDNQLGAFMDGWAIFTNPDELAGVVRIALFSATPHAPGSGDLLSFGFDVEPTAPTGTTALDVEGGLNEGRFEIVAVDGDFTVPLPNGDFNGDALFDCEDIDALVAEIAGGGNNPLFELTGDAVVDLLDRDAWLALAGAANGLPSAYLVGDGNLDGVVDGQDFILWNQNKFTSMAAWCAGDFNADGFVDGQDFILWNQNKFQSSDLVSPGASLDSMERNLRLASLKTLRHVSEVAVAAAKLDHLPHRRVFGPARVDSVFAKLRRGEMSSKNDQPTDRSDRHGLLRGLAEMD